MENDKSLFNLPSYAREPVYVFPDPEDADVYQELAAISEEIQKCRDQHLNT